MDKYFILVPIVTALILTGRIIVMNYFFKHTKTRKTKHPTEAKFEINTSDTAKHSFTIERKKNDCLITISNFSEEKEEILTSFTADNCILNDLESIINKYNLPSVKEWPNGHKHEGRSFSIDYGNAVRYFVRYYQQLSPEFISMLDEIENVLRTVVPTEYFI